MSTPHVSPTGASFEIAHGAQRAVITEVGATLRSYDVDGVPIVEGSPADVPASGGRGQLLLPWPNRIRDGRYTFDGRNNQLALSDPGLHNASHGLVRWEPWSFEAYESHRVALNYTLYPHPGYPFTLRFAVEYALSASGLTVRVRATNAGTARCPYGAGAHPYLAAGGKLDKVLFQMPAASYLKSDAQQIPVEKVSVEGSAFDFRAARAIGETKLDTAFTDFARDESGVARTVLQTSHGQKSHRVTVWMDSTHTHLMVYSGDTLPDEKQRRTGLAVEPMTCAPNAFATGEAIRVLEPGESTVSVWGIGVEQA
jgi:galactose mutarotase-like enzyme